MKASEIKNGTNHDIYKMELPPLSIGGSGNGTTIWFVNSKMNDVDFNYEVIKEYVFPNMMRVRAEQRSKGLPEAFNALYDRMLLWCDGEANFLAAMLKFMKTKEWEEGCMMFSKGSPATTGVPSGNAMDQCSSFKNMKANNGSMARRSKHLIAAVKKVWEEDETIDGRFGYDDVERKYEEDFMCVKMKTEATRLGIAPDHMKDLQRFMFRMKSIFPKAFTPDKLSLGFQLGGIFPEQPRIPLSYCAGYQALSTSEKRDIITSILPAMVKEMAKEGEVSDKFMDDLGLSAGTYGENNVVDKPFDEKTALNQHRAMFPSHPKQVAKRVGYVLLLDSARQTRMNDAKPNLVEIKNLVSVDPASFNMTTKLTRPMLRGVLELLQVPAEEFLNGPGTALKFNKEVIVNLVRKKVVELLAYEALPDNFEED